MVTMLLKIGVFQCLSKETIEFGSFQVHPIMDILFLVRILLASA